MKPLQRASRSRPARRPHLWTLLAAASLSACGGDGGDPFGTVPGEPAAPPSCADLQMGAPRTGGTFACSGCVRHWRWELPEPGGELFLLLELTCHETTDASLTLRDAAGSAVWEGPVLPGAHPRICIRHAPARAGAYRLTLAGQGPGGLTRFSGSLWINAFDGRGLRLAPLREEMP